MLAGSAERSQQVLKSRYTADDSTEIADLILRVHHHAVSYFATI